MKIVYKNRKKRKYNSTEYIIMTKPLKRGRSVLLSRSPRIVFCYCVCVCVLNVTHVSNNYYCIVVNLSYWGGPWELEIVVGRWRNLRPANTDVNTPVTKFSNCRNLWSRSKHQVKTVFIFNLHWIVTKVIASSWVVRC